MGTSAAHIISSESRPDTAAVVLSAARDRRRTADLAEAELLALAVEWAVIHPAESIHEPATHTLRGFGETDLAIAGEGAPTVAEYAVPEFAAGIGLSTEAGKRYLGQALELRYRLPRHWVCVQAGELPGWKARLVARETIRLSREAAAYVDTHVAPVAHRLKPAQLDRAVNEAIGRFMPDEVQRLAEASWDKRHVSVHDQLVSFTGTMHVDAELDIADALDLEAAVAAGAERRAQLGSDESLDVRRAQAVGDLARSQLTLDLNPQPDPAPWLDSARTKVKPRQVILHLHLAEAAVRGDRTPDRIARLERGNALVSVDQVRTWCGNPDAQVVVKPVIDLTTCTRSDSDGVTDAIAEHVAIRDKTCVFPWCTRPARRCHPDQPEDHPCDCDHVHPRGQGGPTCTCNIAPLCRRHHRLKTHSPWTYLVLDPGTYLWTSTHGYHFLRDRAGGTVDVTPIGPARRHPTPDQPRPRLPGMADVTPMPRSRPLERGSERAMLESMLDFYRATVVNKVAGLTEDQAFEAAVPPSTLTPATVVKHLAGTERFWFSIDFADLDVVWPWGENDLHGNFGIEPGDTLATIVAAYVEECAGSRRAIQDAELDDAARGEGMDFTLRFAMLHMIEETARHCGHLDLLREAIDGAVGA